MFLFFKQYEAIKITVAQSRF